MTIEIAGTNEVKIRNNLRYAKVTIDLLSSCVRNNMTPRVDRLVEELCTVSEKLESIQNILDQILKESTAELDKWADSEAKKGDTK